MIQTYCLKCGRLLRLPDNAAGKAVKCPACGATVQAPVRNEAGNLVPAKPEPAEPIAASVAADESGETIDDPENQPTGEPTVGPGADQDLEYAPPLPEVEPPIDMRFVWRLTWGAIGVVLLATLIIVGASLLSGKPWQEVHRDQMMALMDRAEEEATQGNPDAAYNTYRELFKLVGDHKVDDPILSAKLSDAKAMSDQMYERVLAKENQQTQENNAALTPKANTGVPEVAQPPTTRSLASAEVNEFPAVRPRVGAPPHPATLPILTDDQVGWSISKGADFLVSLWGTDGVIGEHINYDYDNHRQGVDALCVYALLQASHAIHDTRLELRSPFMQAALTGLKNLKMDEPNDQTYARSLRVQALALAGRPEDKLQMEADVRWLLQTQKNGAYTYDAHDPRSWDNSNSQYGLLGVWAAAEDDEPIPLNFWRLVEKHWTSCQNANGQWGYQNDAGTGSMTTAGVNALFVTHDYLDPVDLDAAVGRPPFTPELGKGLTWLETGDNCMFNQIGRVGRYGLYGLERVGLISGFKYFGAHDWFRELGAQVIEKQWNYGPWGGDPIETSFAMLFLSRGRHPVMINKLRFDGVNGAPAYWANRPRDVANLARYTSRILERPFSWQVVPLKADWREWTDAPVLYLASHEPPPLMKADEEKLRQYVLNGGLLVTQADGDSPSFDEWATNLGRRLFPSYQWSDDLPPTDQLFSVGQKVKNPPSVRAISNGSRLLMVHLRKDISKYWQARDEAKHQEAFDLGVNLYVYASGRTDFRNRLVTTDIPVTPDKPAGSIKLAELTMPTDNPEPAAWPRFARHFRATTNLGIRILPTSLETLKFSTAPIAHLTGITRWELTESQVKALHDYVQSGGVVLIDPCGGPNDFQQFVLQALLPRAFPGETLDAMTDDHPLFAASSDGMINLGKAQVRDYVQANSAAIHKTGTDFQMLRSGKGCVIVAPLDITSGLLGTSTWGIAGYEPAYALAFAKNWVIWAWDGALDK